MSAANIERTKKRLEQRIAEGQYYEAHQQLRVLTQRYIKSRNFSAAIDILTTGAHALLKAGQSASGGDLALLLVEVYRISETAPSHLTKSRLLELITAIPAEEPSRKRFINETLAWSAKFGEFPAGDPELHHFVGNLFAQEEEVYDAERHLILGTANSPEVLANLLFDWYKDDEPHTAASYVARAVFGYLLIGNIRDASRALQVFVDRLVSETPDLVVQNVESATHDMKVFPSLPLLNFLSLLVAATQMGGQDTFRNLKSHYAGKLKEVSVWEDALEQVGEMYFDVKIRKPTSIFDMMGSMFGGAPGGNPGLPQIGGPGAVDLD